MKKNALTVKFLLNSFLTAVVINTIVISAHILTAKDFSYSESGNVILISLAVSTAIFAVVSIVLSLITMLLKQTSKEKRFWILMIIGILATVLLFFKFDHLFAAYSDGPAMIAAISAFSILVSLTAQYELLTDENYRGTFDIQND